MENELKRVECWTGFQARNYDEKRDDDGTFYYADEVDEVLASLRARLEAAERERDRWQREVGVVTDRLKATSRDLDAFKAEAECHSKNHDAALDQRDAALRELAEARREILGAMEDGANAAMEGVSAADAEDLPGTLARLRSERDAATALLRDICDARYKDELQDEISRADAHLTAASPSPLASPEGDGAGRECERPMDLIERSRADLDLMDYEGARRAQEVIHIYVCPNERCSGGLIMDGRGGVLGRCKVCNPRRAQGGDSNAEGSGA